MKTMYANRMIPESKILHPGCLSGCLIRRSKGLRHMRILMGAIIALTLMAGSFIFAAPMTYAAGPGLLTDGADLMSDEEEGLLLEKLESVSEKRDCDIAVITTGDLSGKDSEAYVDDTMDEMGLGKGRSHGTVTLLIYINDKDPSDREVRIATDETANYYFSDRDNEYVLDVIIRDLSQGNYTEACLTYADTCDQVFAQTLDNGQNNGNEEKNRGVSPFWLIGDLGIGAVIALILGSAQKSKLKSNRGRRGAAEYKADGGIHFLLNRDIFLNRRIERRRIDREGSDGHEHQAGTTHTTSSGGKHGGAGRRF